MTTDAWLPSDPVGSRLDEERAVDADSERAEEFAESVGVDPTPQQVEEYVEMQQQDPPD